jgi:hypothetical protein
MGCSVRRRFLFDLILAVCLGAWESGSHAQTYSRTYEPVGPSPLKIVFGHDGSLIGNKIKRVVQAVGFGNNNTRPLDGEFNFSECEPETTAGDPDCPSQCCSFGDCCDPDPAACRSGDYCDPASACCSETTCCVPNRSWAGIDLGYGQYSLADGATVGFGVTVAGSTVIASDALRGGGISIDRGWHPPPTPATRSGEAC